MQGKKGLKLWSQILPLTRPVLVDVFEPILRLDEGQRQHDPHIFGGHRCRQLRGQEPQRFPLRYSPVGKNEFGGLNVL